MWSSRSLGARGLNVYECRSQPGNRDFPREHAMKHSKAYVERSLSDDHSTNRFSGAAALIAFCVAWYLGMPAGLVHAESETCKTQTPCIAIETSGSAPQSATAALPSLDSIDAQSDITVFLGDDVPAPLRLAALRRAWSADPAIRDFRGLQESDWDFDDPDGIPGFGKLGPEVDVQRMAAHILGEMPQVVAQAPDRPPLLHIMLSLF
jgi:hypothetical protein